MNHPSGRSFIHGVGERSLQTTDVYVVMSFQQPVSTRITARVVVLARFVPENCPTIYTAHSVHQTHVLIDLLSSIKLNLSNKRSSGTYRGASSLSDIRMTVIATY